MLWKFKDNMLQIILLNNPHHANPLMNIFLIRGFNYLTDYEIQTIIGRKNQVHVVLKKADCWMHLKKNSTQVYKLVK